ncbi:MAG: transglutaminase family protein, partial [Pseudomonadota bacterium]
MKLNVSHRTSYRYASAVSFSQHVLRLEPRPSERQAILNYNLTVEPKPTRLANQSDFYGNRVNLMTMSEPHDTLEVHASSEVDTQAAAVTPDDPSVAWEQVAQACQTIETEAALEASRFCFASRRTRANDDIAAYARETFLPGRQILDAAVALSRRIHEDFVYAPGSTTASTPVDQSFANRKGVCQDFAHVMLACLRALRLPGRYVSGYLLTLPPDGKLRLVGADASHAWVS